MKKSNIAVVIITAFMVLAFFILQSLESGNFSFGNKINVESYDAIIEIDEDGSMNVSETWVVNWPDGMSVSFRDIGYQKYDDSNPLRQDINNRANFNTDVTVEVFDRNGARLTEGDDYRVGFSFRGDRDELGNLVECYPARNECESIFIQVYGGMQKQMTFKYRYTIEGAVTKYTDTAELNWNLLEYFESGIKSANVEIVIPNANKDEILAWGHGLSKGEVIIEDGKVVLDIERIKSNEFLEFRILFPKDLVDVPARNDLDFPLKNEIIEYQDQLAIETNRRIAVARIIFIGTIILIALTIYFVYRIYQKYDKEHKSAFDLQYYRELPQDYSPAEMSYLYHFKRINNEDLTATILDLIRRKYLVLDTLGERVTEKNPNFKLIKNPNPDPNDTLLPHEAHVLKWFIDIVGDGSEVTLRQIEEYPKGNVTKAKTFDQNAKDFVRLAKLAGEKHDFFDDVNKSGAYSYVIIPIVYLIITLFVKNIYNITIGFTVVTCLAIIFGLILYIANIKRRSVNGNEDYVRWRAFKNFLEDFGRMEDYPMPGIVIWEHYLVYATSLKIADKVMEQLEVRLPSIEEVEGFNQSTFIGFGYRYYGFRLGYTFGRINSTINTARMNSVKTITSHTASSVGLGGRGGGFGGGSSFGGGGGGFRGR